LSKQAYTSYPSIHKLALLAISMCVNINLIGQSQDTIKRDISSQPDSSHSFSNQSIKQEKDASKTLVVKFLQKDALIKEEDILSNTLSIVNNTDLSIDFSLNVNIPYNWTDISDNGQHHLNPGDSIFIPIHVIPASEVKGGTEYVINAFLVSKQGNQLASGYFFAHTQKITKWFISVLPENRIYFLNHCDTASFQVNISNNGNHQEDILLNLNNVKKQGMLMDTNGKILHTNFCNVQINPQEDTTLSFKMKYTGSERNYKAVDLEDFSGLSNTDAKTFPVWINGQEAKKTDSSEYIQSKSITFVKLNDVAWANPYSSEVFPLTVDMNTYNILGAQPVMNIYLHGDAFLNNEARLFYSGNLYYSTYELQKNYFNGDNFYVGYFDKRGDDIQVGQLGMPYSYGVSIGGLGIEGDYRINTQNSVGGIFVDGYNNSSIGAGAWDKYKFLHESPILDNQIFVTSIGLVNGLFDKTNTYFVSETGGLHISKYQYLTFAITVLDKDYYNAAKPFTFIGGVYIIGYHGVFIRNRLTLSDQFIKASYDTNIVNKDRITLSNTIAYQLSNTWRLQMQNSYYSYSTPYYLVTPTTYSLTDYLYFMHSNDRNVPYIFYNIYTGENVGLDYFGVGDRYSYFNKDDNFMLQAGVQGGYNHLAIYPFHVNDYFTAQPNLLLKYHTLTFLSYYTYGPNGIPSESSLSSQEYPQLLMISIHQQYQFANRHLVLDHGLNYSYFNQFKSHTLAYEPELYYFTNGWRFKIGFSYAFNSTNIASALVYSGATLPNGGETNVGPQISNNLYLNFGIKKDFGIPIPKKWTRYEYKTVTFISFLDVNGDGKKEPNETVLENVVVSLTSRMHRYEVLTDDKGAAKMFNLSIGRYYETIQSLGNLNGWFSTSSDTITIGNRDTVYVPFSKGVKLFGAIIYHPTQYSVIPKIDLSHIQVTATDSTGKGYGVLTNANGEFMIYVPSGKYTVTMNEDFLDDNFKVSENNIKLTLNNGIDNIYQSFYISEKPHNVDIKDFSQPSNPSAPDQVPHH